jgi:hypothetical protein
VIQKLKKRLVEPADIERTDGLEVQAELKPGQYLNHLFESADAPEQRYEGIRKLSHAMLALVHGLNRNKLRKTVMCALLCNHRAVQRHPAIVLVVVVVVLVLGYFLEWPVQANLSAIAFII